MPLEREISYYLVFKLAIKPMNTTYEPFSDRPEYKKVNHDFLSSILSFDQLSEKPFRVLDLACGTGTLDDILFDILPNARIIGVDISRESLDIGREKYSRLGLLESSSSCLLDLNKNQGAIYFMEISADDISFASGTFDLVMMGNSIHMLPDKPRLLRLVANVLKSDGLFLFNTAFFNGTYPVGTEYIYTEWIKSSLEYIEEVNQRLRHNGDNVIKRSRVKGNKAFDKGWLSPLEWCEILDSVGFETFHVTTREMQWTQETFETVGSYSGFAEVMMSGYPIDIACESLEQGAKAAFEKSNVTSVPRLWLEVAAKLRK